MTGDPSVARADFRQSAPTGGPLPPAGAASRASDAPPRRLGAKDFAAAGLLAQVSLVPTNRPLGMTVFIWVVALALLAYAIRQKNKGVLR
jgi:hypothetical protein